MSTKEAIERLIYQSCILLDEKDFKGYLDLCDPAFRYTITAYSPEIRKEMTWLDHDKQGMENLFFTLPKHNSDHTPLTRHATVYTVDYSPDGKQANVLSALQVYRTALDGGTTELFAVGRLHDTVNLDGERPTLVRRNVRLETRMLGIGYHIPL